MIRTHGLTHLALGVRDTQRAFRFYEQVFGAVKVYDGEGVRPLRRRRAAGMCWCSRRRGTVRAAPAASAHFGFRLVDAADIDEAARLVEEAGGILLSRGEFVPGEPYIFFQDLDGYEVEIWFEQASNTDPA